MAFGADMDRLQAIVERFESGELEMEESLALFEEGVKLIRECRGYLEGARRRVTVLASENEEELEREGA